jgi:PDZ domain-containing protein
MRRRGLTVLLGFVLTALLAVLVGSADVPYVALSPGPTVNTLGAVDRNGDACTDPAPPAPSPSAGASAAPEPACQEVIQITGTPTSTGDGQLRMVTVSVQSNVSLLDAIVGWFAGDEAVVPRKLIYPEDKPEEQVEQENRQEFEQSQTTAETAALTYLGYPVQVSVSEITPDGASAGKLEPGDVIQTVDGVAVTSPQNLVEVIRSKPAGTVRQIGYTRNGVAGVAEVTSKAGEDGSPKLGVVVKTVQPHPFDLTIKLDKIGGPSAGMMFALGIIDKVKPEDLTNGFVVAGTGTIDDEGRVGPIGGIAQKLHGAKAAGATVFLAPADNCDEARANVPDGLRVVKVSTLDDALAALAALPGGGPLPSC